MAAKTATVTIPIVFSVGVDPVKVGLVKSLNKPGGNLTGVTNQNVDIAEKRLELMHELLPAATTISVLVNPTGVLSEPFLQALQPAARTLGLKLDILNASADRDFDTAFATLVQQRASALVISTDNFFNTRAEQLAALSLRHAVPAIYHNRPFVVAGGLISYGSDEAEYYRLAGIYAGRSSKARSRQTCQLSNYRKSS